MLVPLLLWLISSPIAALEVASDSPCTAVCDGSSLTFPSDLTCIDTNYSATSSGSVFKACLQCEASSTAVDGAKDAPQNNDVYWFLFNMKYTLQYCLTQDGKSSTPNFASCEADCAGLFPVLETSWFSTPRPAQYAFCSQNDTAFQANGDSCANCLRENEGSVVLGNFIKTMLNACDSKPQASKGETVKIQRALFNTATVNPTSATTSTPAPTSSSSSSPTSSATSVPATTPSSTSSSASSSSGGGLSTGAAAGIGVGCALAACLVLGLLVYFSMRRRKNRKTAKSSAVTGGEQKPLNQEDSPYQGSYAGQDYPSMQDKKRVGEPAVEMHHQQPLSEMQNHERYEMPGHGQMSPRESRVEMQG